MAALTRPDHGTALMIAADLLKGGTAKIVGNSYLLGTSPQYVEIDGVPTTWPSSNQNEAAIGVQTTLPDGYLGFYLTTTHERAQSLLRAAEKIVAEQRGEPSTRGD